METETSKLAEWVESLPIATTIIDVLIEEGVEGTVENGKEVWLDVLEYGINDTIKTSVERIFLQEA